MRFQLASIFASLKNEAELITCSVISKGRSGLITLDANENRDDYFIGAVIIQASKSAVSDMDPAANHTEVLADQKFHQQIVEVEKLVQEATTPLRRWEESL